MPQGSEGRAIEDKVSGKYYDEMEEVARKYENDAKKRHEATEEYYNQEKLLIESCQLNEKRPRHNGETNAHCVGVYLVAHKCGENKDLARVFTKVTNLEALIFYCLLIATYSNISVNHICICISYYFHQYKRILQ